jgi:hypothetical protein
MISPRRKKRLPLRKAWNRQATLEQLVVSAREKLAAMKAKLEVMSLPELTELAGEKSKDVLHREARKLFAARTGQGWDDFHKAVIANKQKAEQKRLAELRAEYEKLSVPDLYHLLSTQPKEFGLIWQVLKAKLKMLLFADQRKRVDQLRAEYKELSLPELHHLLTLVSTQAKECGVVWQVLKAKVKTLVDDERMRHAAHTAIKARPKAKKLSTQTESATARNSNYLKPISKHYDMPEYDLE